MAGRANESNVKKIVRQRLIGNAQAYLGKRISIWNFLNLAS
jgi:hypothetical protein